MRPVLLRLGAAIASLALLAAEACGSVVVDIAPEPQDAGIGGDSADSSSEGHGGEPADGGPGKDGSLSDASSDPCAACVVAAEQGATCKAEFATCMAVTDCTAIQACVVDAGCYATNQDLSLCAVKHCESLLRRTAPGKTSGTIS